MLLTIRTTHQPATEDWGVTWASHEKRAKARATERARYCSRLIPSTVKKPRPR
jgi:hypothetical protein